MPSKPSRPTWSGWRPFPNPRKSQTLTAPIGPGLYELRRRSTGELILIGIGRNVAERMTSLLPHSRGGKGTRNNSRKRRFVARHTKDIQYRTCATRTRAEAVLFERRRLRLRTCDYRFPT